VLADSQAVQWRLRGATFLSSFDRFAIPPLLVPISAAFGIPLGTAALVASAYFIAYGVSQPFWGALSDRVGRVKVIRFSVVAGAVCCVVAALAPSFTVLIVSRTISGVLFAAIVPTVVTYIGDTVDVQQRQHALTLTIASASAGIAVATIIGGLCAELISWRAAFLSTSVLAVILSLALTRIPEPVRPRSSDSYLRLAKSALAQRWVLVVLAIGFIEGAVILGSLTFISASLQEQGVGAAIAGSAAAGFGIANVCCVPVVTRAIKRFASPLMIAFGSALAAAGLLIAAADTAVATALIAALGLGAGFGFLHPTMQLWATQVNAQARAVTVSFFAGSVFVGGAAASAAAAPLADGGSFSLIFLVAAALALLLASAGARLRSRYVSSIDADRAASEASPASL
jgi:predicted MFS family arabinose efflux permease